MLHAGTRWRDDGAVVSAGGRVLSVVGTGPDLAAARDDAYRRSGGSGSSARTTAPTSRCAPPRGVALPGDAPERREPRRRGLTGAIRPLGSSRASNRSHEAARAAIPPFHVMDVWAAAGERQRTHGDLINLSAGQPSTPAPRPVRLAAADALDATCSATPSRWARPSCGPASPRTTATPTACRSTPTTWCRPPARPAASCSPSSPRSTSATASRWPAPATPATATSSRRWAARSSSCRAARRPATSPPSRCWTSLDGIDGLIVASPANPTGTVLPPDELAALAAYCERAGIQLISDEIYHGISYPGAPRRPAPGRPRARRSSSTPSPSTSR